MHYLWPGNVRELQNVLRRTLAMMRHGTLTVDDLPDEILIQASQGNSIGKDQNGFFRVRAQRTDAFEKEYLINLLASCQGDIGCAGRDAQIPRATLYRLLKKHNLDPEDFRSTSQR